MKYGTIRWSKIGCQASQIGLEEVVAIGAALVTTGTLVWASLGGAAHSRTAAATRRLEAKSKGSSSLAVAQDATMQKYQVRR